MSTWITTKNVSMSLTRCRKPPGGVLSKRCSWKFRRFHRKTPVPESLFNKVAGLRLLTLLKNRPRHGYFPVNFAKFLRTPFLWNTSVDCFLRWKWMREIRSVSSVTYVIWIESLLERKPWRKKHSTPTIKTLEQTWRFNKKTDTANKNLNNNIWNLFDVSKNCVKFVQIY